MRVVIIEDEPVASQTLERYIREIRSDFDIVATLESIEDSVEWFSSNPAPDLAFMDIHLADGSSFAIFDQAEVACPVIFTTAYSEYTMEAFEVNGIDYLLKPINPERLRQSIAKFDNLSYRGDNAKLISSLEATLQEKQPRYKSHFLVPHRDKLIPLAVEDVAYCVAEFKVVRVVSYDSRSYSMDCSLEELTRQLDPERFFRVNRQYVVSHRAVDDISVWFAGKLSVNLSVPVPERITVSKARVAAFKSWYTKDY